VQATTSFGRTWTRFVVLWLFGLSTTVLLISMWGRSLSGDEASLVRAAAEASQADVIVNQVASWIGEAVAEADGIPQDPARAAVKQLWQRPDTRATMESLVAQVVEVAFLEPGEVTLIDVSAALQPMADDLAAEVSRLGYPITSTEIEGTLGRIDPIEVAAGAEAPVAGSVLRARSALTLATAASLGGVVAFGAIALALADDRRAMLRDLATRMLLGALSFTVLLRIGSWITDPGAGGSALRKSGAFLLGRSLHVPLLFAAGAATMAAWAAWTVRQRRERTKPVGSERPDSDRG
jgi:hypothetical protein